MSAELRERLQSTLGGSYTLERELGGGGMSRVFVAEERSLGRKVVVKVLSPELAAGLSVERFKREIQVAAKLQQANIVPVLSSGEFDGLPYFTMPLVEGLSLRGRLATNGALPVGECVGILKDVAKALVYAHERGVVHRDIKPDNVLLSGGTAVVTDFGIAKAISASRAQARAEGRTSGSTLTQDGTSLGTPAYMAPEQAAGDPGTDHRADLYALGIMAYEMLAGRTPFHGLSPHKLLAAQLGETPRSIDELRPDAPSSLVQLVTALLAKDPARRPRSAADVVHVLDAVTGTGRDAQAAGPVLLAPRVALWKALAFYAVAAIAVPIVARAAVISIGLPVWVFPASVVVMALGLPMILATHFVQQAARHALTSTPVLTPGGTPLRNTASTMAVKVSPHLTWKRTAQGGMLAVFVIALLAGAYMLMRALGIGPAGSLMAAGVLGEREQLVLADFASPASDSSLGPIVTDALRADLAQSRNLDLLPPATIRESLRRMQRSPDAHLDFPLAREIATREGIKAVIDGAVLGIGGSFVLTARLVATQTGQELATFKEEAEEARDLIPAIGRLSKDIRTKIGESLRTVQAAPPLEQVSTASLEALRKYVQGNRALAAGESDRGVRLLEEAIAIDTTFAMAYRRLAAEINNRGGQRARLIALAQKAHDHRMRLSDTERYLTEALYWAYGPREDEQKTIDAYEALLELQPDNGTALNNLGNRYRERRQLAQAESLYARAVALGPTNGIYAANHWVTQFQLGKAAEAEQSIGVFAAKVPTSPRVAHWRAQFAWHRGDYAGHRAIVDSLRRLPDASTAESFTFERSDNAQLRGQLADTRRIRAEAYAMQRTRGVTSARIGERIDEAYDEMWYRGDGGRAVRLMDQAASRSMLDSVPDAERPYARMAEVYALAGRPDRARVMLGEFDRLTAGLDRRADQISRLTARGEIAIAERRYDDAVTAFREADQGMCTPCSLPKLARAHDMAGNADSAIGVFERYLADSQPDRVRLDGRHLAAAHKRLGELYDAKGDRPKALSHYLMFVDLWKDADTELQPRVNEIRQRIARLRDTEGR